MPLQDKSSGVNDQKTHPLKTKPSEKPINKKGPSQKKSNSTKENQTLMTNFLKGNKLSTAGKEDQKPQEDKILEPTKPVENKITKNDEEVNREEKILAVEDKTNNEEIKTETLTKTTSTATTSTSPSKTADTINEANKLLSPPKVKSYNTRKSPAKRLCNVIRDSDKNDKSTCCNLDDESQEKEDSELFKKLEITEEQLKLKETDKDLFWEQTAEAVRVELNENLDDNKEVLFLYFCDPLTL